MLDRAEPLRPGERRRRLVAVERAAVLAGERLEIPDRLVERGRIVVAERERLAERGERFGVRVEVARVLARDAGRRPRPRRRGRRAGSAERSRARCRGRRAPRLRGRVGVAAVPRSSESYATRRACSWRNASSPPPLSERRPRRVSSSRAVTVSSSLRPLTARIRSASNCRPRTAAAATTCPATSLVPVTRASSRPRTPGGSDEPSACESRYSTTKNGSPCVSSYSRSDELGGRAGGGGELGDVVRGRAVRGRRRSRVRRGSRRRGCGAPDGPAGVSSVRQVTSTRTGRSRSRRTRKASTSSEDASAQCTSSTTSRPGARRSSPRRGRARRRRGNAPARRGRRASASAASPSSGIERAVSAAAAAPTAPASPSRSALRTSSIAQPNASPDSPSTQRTVAATPPPARTRATSSSASRVLPIPVSPSSTTRRPSAPTCAVRVEQRRELALATDERMGRVPATRPAAPARPRRCRPRGRRGRAAVVSSVGATPSSRWRMRTQSRYCASARPRSPLAP